MRELSRKDDPGEYATGKVDGGTRFLKADLDLEGEQWRTLLYD